MPKSIKKKSKKKASGKKPYEKTSDKIPNDERARYVAYLRLSIVVQELEKIRLDVLPDSVSVKTQETLSVLRKQMTTLHQKLVSSGAM